MGKEERVALIRQLERKTNSRLICYVTGDRQRLETKIANDTLPLLYNHLKGITATKRINVFLYTVGGDALAGWAIVSLIREFCKILGIIIPFRALSCGTLIALGADELIMSQGAQLSPVDPSLASPYNPMPLGQKQPSPGATQLLPVSVEDVIGYLNLARDEAGIKEDEGISKIMAVLSEKVHPMALGAVYRSREQIRLLARKLLMMHEKDRKKITKLVDTLTTKLPSHQYLISRKEAEELHLKVSKTPASLDKLIWDLYKDYEEQLQLTVPYNPEGYLRANDSVMAVFDRAVIESLNQDGSLKSHVFRTEREIKRIQFTPPGMPIPQIGIQERPIADQWVEI
jgi:hypothetical protein